MLWAGDFVSLIGLGSRALLDMLLRDARHVIRKGWRVRSGRKRALGRGGGAVFTAQADSWVATPSAARASGLDFVPLRGECFDFSGAASSWIFRRSETSSMSCNEPHCGQSWNPWPLMTLHKRVG